MGRPLPPTSPEICSGTIRIDVSILTRPEPGGLAAVIIGDETADQSGQIVRESNLLGLTVAGIKRRTVNEQLAAMGKRQISACHHGQALA